MALTNLLKYDIAPVDYPGKLDQKSMIDVQFSDAFKLWLGNATDIFNENMATIEAELASFDARITALGG